MGLTIGFDATAAVRQSAGIGRYTRELLWALDQRADENDEFRLFYWAGGHHSGHLPDLGSRFRSRPVPVSDRIGNALWHKLWLPLPVELRIGFVDLFHSPDFSLPPTLHAPTVLTIHDLAFLVRPECAFPTLRAYLEQVVPRSARKADRIIAVSEQTRRDVIAYLGIAPEKVTTVLEGVGGEFRRPAAVGKAREVLEPLGVASPYILSVGTIEPRKNYERLLKAYALLLQRGLEHPLVIAGRKGWLYQPVFETLARLDLTAQVRFVEPDHAQLVHLYSCADVFVYPSLYEGFGLPALEALACGVPVACSSTSSLPEVVGNCAVMFDPEEPEDIANALERLLSDKTLREELVVCGLDRSQRFSWMTAAEETMRLYREVSSEA